MNIQRLEEAAAEASSKYDQAKADKKGRPRRRYLKGVRDGLAMALDAVNGKPQPAKGTKKLEAKLTRTEKGISKLHKRRSKLQNKLSTQAAV